MTDKQLRNQFTIASYFLMIVYGISFTMVGPLMPDILARFDLTLAEGGIVVSVQNLTGLVAVLLCGLFGDRWNKGAVMTLGVLLFTAALIGIGSVSAYPTVILLFAVLGLGSRGFDTLSNALISDLHGSNRSFYLNLLHTFFGVGAFLGPMFIMGVSVSDLSWETSFIVLGILAAGVAVAFVFLVLRAGNGRSVRRANTSDSATGHGIITLLKHSDIWLLGVIMFLHMGTLGILITWMPLFAEQSVGSGRFLSGFALSVMWLGIIISRSLVSRLSSRWGEIPMIRWGALVSTLVFGLALVSGNTILMTVGSLLTGIGIGFTIPFVMSVGCHRFPDRSAAVTSLMFVFGYLSVIVYPWVSGLLGDSLGLGTAMMLIPASQLVLFAVSWGLRSAAAHSKGSTSQTEQTG